MTIEYFLSQPAIFKWNHNGGEYYVENLHMLKNVSICDLAMLKEKLDSDYICLSCDYSRVTGLYDREVYFKREVLASDSCHIVISPDHDISLDGENISQDFSFSSAKRSDVLRFLSEFGYKFSDNAVKRFHSEIKERDKYYNNYDNILETDLDLFIWCKKNNDFEPLRLLAEVD